MDSSSASEPIWFLDGLMRVHAAVGAGCDISVIEHTVPHGSSPPMHVHRDEDEVFHLLEGEVRFVVEGMEIHAQQGQTVVVPRGKPHSFVVTSQAGARWLVITNGRNFERLVRAISRPAESAVIPPAAPPTLAEAKALEMACRANGIDLVGPPLSAVQHAA